MNNDDKNNLKKALKILDGIHIGHVDERGSDVKSGPQKRSIMDEKHSIPSLRQAEENVDEGSPLDSGKYKNMSFIDILKVALSMEADAIEIGLALIEKSTPKYKDKLVEITNDENDHSQIYNGIINDLEGKKR